MENDFGYEQGMAAKDRMKARIRLTTLLVLLILSEILFSQTNLIFAEVNSESSSSIVDVINRFDIFFLQKLVEDDVPGAAVAIVKDDQIIYINTYGVREVGQPEKVDLHTAFRLASVSKGFASVLTGILAKDGILNWDDKVIKYLPRFALKNPWETKNLTIKNLLSHTSGLPAHTYTNLLDEDLPLGDIYQKLKDISLITPVGKVYSYQNVLYGLISDIVKSATGREYAQLVTDHIFQPLGMYDASLGKETFTDFNNCASPHTQQGFGWAATEVKQGYYNVLPAAGVNASILDMARWLRAMMGGAPETIAPEVIQQVTSPIIKTPHEKYKHRWRDHLRDAHYALGWRIYDYAGTTIVYHGGWVQGFRAEMGFIPEEKIGIVVLLNCESMVANLFLPTFFDMYLNLAEPDSTRCSN